MRKAIVLAILVAPALGDDAQTTLDALKKEYEAAVQEFFRTAQEAHTEGDKVRSDFEKLKATYAARFTAFAKEHPKTDAGAQALVAVLHAASDEAARKEATQGLLRDYLDSPALKEAIYGFDEDALKTVAEKSPHAEVRGGALLRLAEIRMRAGENDAALAFLRQVKEKYADVPSWEGTLGQKAESDIFEVEHLGIGKEAPDISGEDLDGKPMKLSDFRGKVVVLDFWGDW